MLNATDLQPIKNVRYSNRSWSMQNQELDRYRVVMQNWDTNEITSKLLPKFQEAGLCIVSVQGGVSVSQFKDLVPYFGQSMHQGKHNVSIDNFHYFPVQVVEGTKAAGLTDRDQAMHVDGVYHDDLPGIMILHCEQQAEIGGDSLFADGLQVYRFLQETYPEGLEAVMKPEALEFDLPFQGGKKIKLPLFKVLKNGRLGFFYTPYAKTIEGSVIAERAYTLATKYIHSVENQIKYRMEDKKDFVLLDNWRYTHGRLAFSGSKQRLLSRVWYVGEHLNLGFAI